MHDLPSSWKNVSIVTKIAKKGNHVLKIIHMSLTSRLSKSIRIKICFDLKRTLILGVCIPIIDSSSSTRIVWIDSRYKLLPKFCYYCDMLMYPTKLCEYK